MRLPIFDQSIQFGCSACGWCCEQPWATNISEADAERYAAVDWGAEFPQLAERTLFKRVRRNGTPTIELTKSSGQKCIFLDSDGWCIVHKKLGFEAKPHMCKQFPYLPVPTADGTRISANYGCKAVQEQSGKPLAEQQEEIFHTVAKPTGAVDEEQPVRLTPERSIPFRAARALLVQIGELFSARSEASVAMRFGKALALLDEAGRQSPETLVQTLLDGQLQADLDPELTQRFENAAQAPMPCRLLFAATLYPDISDPSEAGLLKRFALIPKLMGVTSLKGGYASRLLERNVSVAEVMAQPATVDLSPEANGLLRRYFYSRIWQHNPAGSRLPIVSGIHQHVLDLNAIIYYAHLVRLEAKKTVLDVACVQRGLTLVEFHLANQERLYDKVLRSWFASALGSPALALGSLKMLRFRQQGAPPMPTGGAPVSAASTYDTPVSV